MVKLNTAEELADIYETEYYTDAMTGGQDKRMYLYYQLINSLKQADSDGYCCFFSDGIWRENVT